MLDLTNYNAGIDLPDDRDILAEEFLDMVQILPASFLSDHTPVLNQGNIGACTVFWTSGALFETSWQDAYSNGTPYNQPFDPWKVWEKAKTRGASDTKGWIFQAALTLILDMKHSIGYAKVASPSNTDPEPIKRALWSKYIVATGSKYGDWSKIQKTGVYSEKKTPSGHIFQINGWDDNKVFPSGEKGGFHSPNSWGGVGDFWIPYSMIGSLYSIYIQLDPSDAEALRDIRNVRAKAWADLAQSKGIWNGSNPETLASPEEIRIMLQRALDIMGGRTRQYWVDTFNDFILRGKDLMKIWNEKDGKRIATNDELALMFTRAITRNPDQSKLTLSRFQVAAVIARDFIPKIS